MTINTSAFIAVIGSALLASNAGAATCESLKSVAIPNVTMTLRNAAASGNLWIVVAGLAAHGLFDLLHPQLIDNPGVPSFWPMFCMAYDVVAAACLAFLLRRDRPRARP